MKNQELLDQVMAEREAIATDMNPRRPSRAVLALIIRFSRGLRVWKAQTERIPLSAEEVERSMAEDWPHRVVVEVATLTKERQLRELAQCHAVLKLGQGHSVEAAETLDQLAEWIELIAFVRNDDVVVPNEPKRLRDLYRGAFECVERLRQQGMALVVGAWKEPMPKISDFTTGVLAISPRAIDPGASKRRIIVLDRRDMAGLRFSFGEEGDDVRRH